jgi:hypothetical protein
MESWFILEVQVKKHDELLEEDDYYYSSHILDLQPVAVDIVVVELHAHVVQQRLLLWLIEMVLEIVTWVILDFLSELQRQVPLWWSHHHS